VVARDALEAAVEGRLPTTRLAVGKIYLHSNTPQDLDGGLADLRVKHIP
jgi:hypothetical protein